MASLRWTAPCLLAFLASSCTSSPAAPEANATPDASIATTDASDTGPSKKHDATADARDGAAVDADADASDAPVVPADAPFDASPYVPIDGGDAVITVPAPDVWTWVPFPDAKCRDGSSTGIGVNFNPSSPNLVIFLQPGAACFNPISCALNASSFGSADLAQQFPSVSDGGAPQPGNGILDRTNDANPVQDWNFVFVPYCTGDVHVGNNPAGVIPGLDDGGAQAFVGYRNIDLYLQRLVPTFPQATQVLLTGTSAGGFGAAGNSVHVQRAFGTLPVTVIDDSGPFMEDPYLPVCLQDELRALWGLDSTIGADCDGHCNDPYRFFLDFVGYVMGGSPTRPWGLIESTDDTIITKFFGFGAEDCQDPIPVAESAATFTAGLDDLRTKLASDTNFSTFYFSGSDHTSLGDYNFYSRIAGTTPLTSWVGDVMQGQRSNVGP